MCLIKMIPGESAVQEAWGLVFSPTCHLLGTLSAVVQTVMRSA